MARFRIWHIVAAALMLYLSSGNAWACTTRTIEGTGRLDSRAPISASFPGYSATIAEMRAAAQYERQAHIVDSHAQAHNVFLLFFHTAQQNWKIYVVMNASEVMSWEVRPLFFLAEWDLEFSPEGGRAHASGDEWGLVWASGEPQYLETDFFEFEQHAQDAVISIIGGSFRACPQYSGPDLDFDGKDDPIVWRPSSGMWAALKSSTNYADYLWLQWGLPGDYPFVGDYTGDGYPDLVVWRPSNGNWYICPYYLDCQWANFARQFGLPTDRPVKADFDHDGILDLAVWRPSWGTFFYLSSATRDVGVVRWGLPGDIPVGAGNSR